MASEPVLRPIIQALEKDQIGRMVLRRVRLWRSHRDTRNPRVLCVGYRKTGTTSFGKAMRQLGYSHYGYDQDLHQALMRGDLRRCLDLAEHFDSLDDLPWSEPLFIDGFRKRFPGSYYVLLEREEAAWVSSHQQYFGEKTSAEEALRAFRTHNATILNLLCDEPNLLRMNICAGEGYEKLCQFLMISDPGLPFPQANAGAKGATSPQNLSPFNKS